MVGLDAAGKTTILYKLKLGTVIRYLKFIETFLKIRFPNFFVCFQAKLSRLSLQLALTLKL